MADIRLFGLTVDGAGAIQTIRSVEAAGVAAADNAVAADKRVADSSRFLAAEREASEARVQANIAKWAAIQAGQRTADTAEQIRTIQEVTAVQETAIQLRTNAAIRAARADEERAAAGELAIQRRAAMEQLAADRAVALEARKQRAAEEAQAAAEMAIRRRAATEEAAMARSAAAQEAMASESGALSGISKRLGSIGIGALFAFEQMENGGNRGEGAMRRVLRSVGLLGLAIGGADGALVGAAALGFAALMDFFSKAEKEAKATADRIREHIASAANAGRADDILAQARLVQFGQPFQMGSDGKPKADDAGHPVINPVSQYASGAYAGSLADLQGKLRALTDQFYATTNGFVQISIQKQIIAVKQQLKPIEDLMTDLKAAALNTASQPADNIGKLAGVDVTADSLDKRVHRDPAALAAEREAAKIIRERAEAYTALIDAQDKAQTKRLEGVRGLQDEAASSARLVAAMQQGVVAYQDQTDAERVLDLVRKAGLKTGDEEYDEAVRNATAIVANDRAVKDLQETQKRADEADKQSARALVEEQKRQAQEVDRVLRSSFSSFFTGVLTQGKDEFQSLWDSVKQGFLRMLSDMLAASATAKLAGIFGGMLVPAVAGAQGGVPTLDHNGIPVNVGTMSSGSAAAGYGGAALGGAAVGYGIGQTMYSTSHSEAGNYARGAIGGAAAGAAIGTMLMPGIGTAIGAVAGLIGGILGVGSASRAAAAQMVQAQKDVRDSMDALHAIVANDPLAQGVAQIEADREARRKAIEDAYQGGDATSDQVTKRNAALLEMNTLEDRRIAQLKEEAALQSARAQEDLRVRGLRAQGMGSEADDMAFAAQQQREREDMVRSFGDVIDATEATTLALLDQVQAQEKLAHAAEVAIAAAQKEVDAANTRLSAAQTALNTAKQAATTLQEFSRSLTVANASPVDQLAATRQAFDAATAAARGGDQSAAASLPQLAQAFLDASRAFNASSPAYQQDLKSVQGVIDEIAKQYANQASLQQQIVDLLKAQQATALAALQAAQDAEAKRESDADRAVQQMAFLVAENAGDASGMITAVTALRVDGVSQADALITRLQDLRGTVDDATQRQIDAATFALLENRNAVATAANTEIAAIQAGASVQEIYGLEQIRQAEQARLDANDAAIRQEAALYLQKSAITDQTSAQALAYQAQIDAIELARAQANANALDQIALLQDQVRLMDALSKVGSTDKGGGNVPAGTGGTAARTLVSAASGTADVSRAVARGSEATVASLQATNASLEQTVRVLAAGFTVLQDQLTTLTAEVRDGTAATKRGFEGTRLRAS